MMTGMMLVMGACVFGGLTAVVLMMVNQRIPAMAVAIAAVLVIFAGIAMQVGGYRKLKATSQQEATK